MSARLHERTALSLQSGGGPYIMGSTEIAFQDADKSQLAMAESLASDRIAFAYSILETGLRMCPAEKSRDSDPVLRRVVRSLRSGLLRDYRRKRASFAYFGGKGGEISLQLRLAGGESGIRHRGRAVLPITLVKSIAINHIRPGVTAQESPF